VNLLLLEKRTFASPSRTEISSASELALHIYTIITGTRYCQLWGLGGQSSRSYKAEDNLEASRSHRSGPL